MVEWVADFMSEPMTGVLVTAASDLGSEPYSRTVTLQNGRNADQKHHRHDHLEISSIRLQRSKKFASLGHGNGAQ